jgi:hypothetical protein
MKLSAFAAQTLVDAHQLELKSLDPHRMNDFFIGIYAVLTGSIYQGQRSTKRGKT